MFCCLFKKKTPTILNNLILVKKLYVKKSRSIEIYKCISSNKLYIIKHHRNIDYFKNELNILSKLYHKNIIEIIYSQNLYKTGYLKIPYYVNGDLFNYLDNNYPINLEKVKFFFKNIANTINYCHKKNIIHRDLKLENFVLDENLNPILIDFENSFQMPKDKYLINSYNICGTTSYISPESYIFKLGYCSDIWSLGCLLYYLIFKCGPLDEYLNINNNMISYNDWDVLNLYIKYPKSFPNNQFLSLIKDILDPFPNTRININDILNHSSIKN